MRASAWPESRQAWQYALPAAWDLAQVRFGDGAVVLGGSDIRVLDSGSGRLRWQRDRRVSAARVVAGSIVYGTSDGAVEARALRDGSLRWERPAVCPRWAPEAAARVSIIVDTGDDLIVGCHGGAVARLAADSGAVLARSDDIFPVDQAGEILPLPSCALGVTGWSSGAALREHMTILDCKTLRAILPDRDETWILGAIGNVAVLNDMCCLRADVYRPAAIVRLNLATRALSPEVYLTPEPQRYPANQRPVGQGSAAMLDGAQLYLAVDRAIYGYGDARALRSSPQRIADGLADFPVLLAHGLWVIKRTAPDGTLTDEIVRIHDGAFERRWSSPERAFVTFGYDVNAAPDVVRILRTDRAGIGSELLVRVTDGAQLFVHYPCRMFSANEDIVATLCSTKQLVGNRYLQYIAAYRWGGLQNHEPGP